mgnify:FL=1
MSALFKQVDGDSVVVVQGGVFKVCDLYERNDGELYAKYGGGFIRLHANGATSKQGASVNALVSDLPLTRDQFGRLCAGPGPKRKQLDGQPSFLAIEQEKDT